MSVHLTWKKNFENRTKDEDLEVGRLSFIIQLGSTESSRETSLVEVSQVDVTVKESQRDTASLALKVHEAHLEVTSRSWKKQESLSRDSKKNWALL